MATILESHEEVAVCYAMREELVQLYELRDEETARQGWLDWFAAAKTNGIPSLVRFAELKEKRLPGLAAHATTPISTEKLEGFNNVIKTAKRAAYGYLNKVFSKADKVAIGYQDHCVPTENLDEPFFFFTPPSRESNNAHRRLKLFPESQPVSFSQAAGFPKYTIRSGVSTRNGQRR